MSEADMANRRGAGNRCNFHHRRRYGNRTFPPEKVKDNTGQPGSWKQRLQDLPYEPYHGTDITPYYYQENAIVKVLDAIAEGQGTPAIDHGHRNG
ncbi:MAG: hypothetical protein U5J95_12460 [Balneolaceae bacterium]|nr:hypothetical protein [Balneolaceae bacterium]